MPILGKYVDHKGKAASMLIMGSLLLIACHLTFAFILPELKGNAIGGVILAYITILVLGASFSLVPASPLLIGKVLDKTNSQLVTDMQNGLISAEEAAVSYDYTAPLVMLACLGAAALVLGFVLKIIDKKKGYGLELPNITE